MEALQRVIEDGAAGGISRLIAYLGMAAIGLMIVAGLYAYARRKFWRAVRGITHPFSTAAEGVTSVGKSVGKSIVKTGIPLVTAASEHVVPALRGAGTTAFEVARTGASTAAAAFEAAKPLAIDAASRAVQATLVGKALALEGAERMAPLLQTAATSAAEAGRNGVSLASETAIAAAPHVRKAAGVLAETAVGAGSNMLALARSKISERAPIENEEANVLVNITAEAKSEI